MKPRILVLFIVVLIAALVISPTPIHGQEQVISIKYGDTVQGTVTAAKFSVLYGFNGKEGDTVSITMTRKSGSLKPVVALFDPTQPKDDMLLIQGTPSADGKTSSIAHFTLPGTGVFGILATRDGVSKGTTTGQYSLTLTNAKPARKPSSTPRTSKATAAPTESPSITTQDGVDSFPVGKLPTRVVVSDDNVYVSNLLDGTVSILDKDGSAVGKVTIGKGYFPTALAWDGTHVWVASLNDSSNVITIIDAKGKTLSTFKTTAAVHSFSYDADNQRMWMADWNEKKVVAMNLKGKEVASVDTETEPEAVLWDGTRLWATLVGNDKGWDSRIIAIDAEGNITGTFDVGKGPSHLAWNDADEVLYVSNYQEDTVMALDAEGSVINTYKVGNNPGAMAWDGERLWVALTADKAITALSADGETLFTRPFSVTVGDVAWDGDNIWVTNGGSQAGVVTRINAAAVFDQ